MASMLDDSVSAMVARDGVQYGIHQGKVIDLSKLNVETVRKVINDSSYKVLEIDSLREFIEKALT